MPQRMVRSKANLLGSASAAITVVFRLSLSAFVSVLLMPP